MESAFSSSSVAGDGVSDQFPAGLRVLVVDDDTTCLRILERMLKNCLYEVTTCNRAEVALAMLRENRSAYDVVISDVHMPDMDGFKLLEHVVLEMEIPVIMMSADDSKNVVIKAVTHGACDYLIKPVGMEALKNIWQHVVRNKKHEWEGEDTVQSSSTLQKPRVVWSVELHRQFVVAVNQVGIDKAVPKKILELMNVPGLTREDVASHLQKYRLYLRRLSGTSQHQNGLNAPFEPPRFVNGQQEASDDSKHVSLLHGIPTSMEPKQLANLHAAQPFLAMNGSSKVDQSDSRLAKMTQLQSGGYLIIQINGSQVPGIQSSNGLRRLFWYWWTFFLVTVCVFMYLCFSM